MKKVLIILGTIMTAGTLWLSNVQAEVKVSAVLEPSQIVQGQEAVLRVSIAGASRAQITLPEVSGLQFTSSGQSTSIQIINFNRMDTAIYAYRVNGFNPGSYTIPALSVEAGGEVKQTAPLTLTILKSQTAAASTSEQSGSAEASESGKISIDKEQLQKPYFLQMEFNDERIYVGQAVPVTFRLFVIGNIRFGLKSLPMLVGESFTLGSFSNEPMQSRVGIEGVPYNLLVWSATITPVKAGEFSISARQLAEVEDRDRVLGGGSSILDQLLARTQSVEVELKTKVGNVKVLPLPSEGKPASFSGGIGNFTFVAQAAPTELISGEPMELVASIEGRGNFNRIDWPGMKESKQWRTYKPSASFKAVDTAGFEGKKTYRQALIPLSAEVKEFPMLQFSYFDPVKGQYQTLRSDPIALQVQAAPIQAGPGPVSSPSLAQAASDQGGLELSPNRLKLGSTGASLEFWPAQSWFVWLLIIPGILILGCVGYKAFRAYESKWGSRNAAHELERTLEREVREMQLAMQQSDGDTFVLKARRVLQQTLAREWNCPPESVTRHEVRQRQPKGVGELEMIFSELDAIDYSGAALDAAEMQRLYGSIQQWLQAAGKGGKSV
ncbi:MAG: BatD family protein [Blastochloris sp.]|nr:BatD family protein [Blastochloris sp.]